MKNVFTSFERELNDALPRHDAAVPVCPLHGVCLAAPGDAVGEQETILALHQVANQRKANLLEHLALGGILIENILKRKRLRTKKATKRNSERILLTFKGTLELLAGCEGLVGGGGHELHGGVAGHLDAVVLGLLAGPQPAVHLHRVPLLLLAAHLPPRLHGRRPHATHTAHTPH